MAFSGRTLIINFMYIDQLVQKLIGRHALKHTHTQTQRAWQSHNPFFIDEK